MTIIYGVDTEKPITPIDARDAIVRCFVLAHKEILKNIDEIDRDMSEKELEELKTISVNETIHFFFKEIGGDYEKPTKDSLIGVCDKVRDFSKNFRKPEDINKHYNEIMILVEKL